MVFVNTSTIQPEATEPNDEEGIEIEKSGFEVVLQLVARGRSRVEVREPDGHAWCFRVHCQGLRIELQ
jgi:hypothetical protein